MPMLTYREAAKRVGRSVLTIKRWRRKNHLTMGWDVRGGQRVRVVDERVLLACWRERMNSDPIHQKRLLRLRNETRRGE
jgi:transposase